MQGISVRTAIAFDRPLPGLLDFCLNCGLGLRVAVRSVLLDRAWEKYRAKNIGILA
jgi:hypothetical protein